MADGGSRPAGAPDPEMDIDVRLIADESLRRQLSVWVGADKAERSSTCTCYYYGLNHRYVEDGFSLNSLQHNEKDRELSRPFVDLVNTLPIEVFLALLERDEDAEQNGTPKNGSESYFVRKLVDLDGHPYASGFPLHDTFNGVVRPVLEPAQTSNHLEAALIFIPRDTVAEFFLGLHKITNNSVLARDKSSPDLRKILIRYANLCLPHGPRRTRLMPILQELVAGVLEMEEKMDYECLTEEVFAPVGRALSRARDWALLERIVIQSKGVHGLGLTDWVGVLVKGGHVALQDVEKWMTACVASSPSIHKRCEALEKFLTGSAGEGGTRLWTVKMFIQEILQEPPGGWFSVEDGNALVTMLFRLFEFTDATVHLIAFAEKHAAQTTLMIGVVVQLNELISSAATSDSIPILGARMLFNSLAKQTVDVLDISKLCTSSTAPLRKLLEITVNNKVPTKQSMESHLNSIYITAQSPMLPIKPEQLGRFISALFRQKVNDSILMQLAFKTVAKAPLIRRPELFTDLWLPFLRVLIGVLEANKIPLSTPRYGHMFAAILEAYISSSKGPKPEVIPWTAHPSNMGKCACTPCAVIRKFINDPIALYEGDNATPEQVNHIRRHCLDGLNGRTLCEHDVYTGRVSIKKIASYTPGTQSQWTHAKQTTSEEMRRFDVSKLREILDADFDNIWNLEDLALPEAPVRFPPPPPVARQEPHQQVPQRVPQHHVALPPRPPVAFNPPLWPESWITSVPPSHMNPTYTALWNTSRSVAPVPPIPNPQYYLWTINCYVPSVTPLPLGNNPNAPHLPSIRQVTMALPPAIRPLSQLLNNRAPMPPPTAPRHPAVTPSAPSPDNTTASRPPPRPPGVRCLDDRFPPRPSASTTPVQPVAASPRPVVASPSSTVPETPKNQKTSASDSPRAYAMYASEIEGSLRKRFPNSSSESITRVLRKRWDSLEEKDKAMYNELALKKSSEGAGASGSGSGGGGGSAGVSSGSGSKSKYGTKTGVKAEKNVRTPVRSRSNSGVEVVGSRSVSSGGGRSSSSRAASNGNVSRTPLQATSGNAQRGSGSAAAGVKRKFGGGHAKSSRPAPSLREATLAGELYYPHVGPMGSGVRGAKSAKSAGAGSGKGGKGGVAEVIDLTLDD